MSVKPRQPSPWDLVSSETQRKFILACERENRNPAKELAELLNSYSEEPI